MYLCQRGLLSLVLALTAGSAAAAPPQEVPSLKGQPIQPVIAKLGAPGSQQSTGGGTTYVWTIQARVDTPTLTTTTDYSAGRPNTVETMRMVPQMQSCTLTLVADGAGVITAAEQQGPYQACSAVSQKLSQR